MNDKVIIPPEGFSIALTEEGKERLSQVVREARSDKSYRSFKVGGLSRETIRNIENKKYDEVRRKTLQDLAPYTPYSCDQLVAIGQIGPRTEVKDALVVSDMWLLVSAQPVEEQLQLIERILAKSPLDNSQIARIQRAIAHWLEEKPS